jgi:lipoprotein-releasing system permease protein
MYKLLLCWRYLRTRWIALASIVSVTLGVATLIVVNSVMDGFAKEMNDRIHGILSDVVIESHSMSGIRNPQDWETEIRRVLGPRLEGMTTVITVPAMLTFQFNGAAHTQQINLIGIDNKSYASVSDFSQYLLHPSNREQISFDLRESGYAPDRPNFPECGWLYRIVMARRQKAEAQIRADIERSQQLNKQIEEIGDNAQTTGGTAPQSDVNAIAAQGPSIGASASDVGSFRFDPEKETHTGVVLGIGIGSIRYRDPEGTLVERYVLRPGDDISIAMPGAGTPPRAIDGLFTVVDFYESKMSEYDSTFAFVPVEKLQQVLGMVDPVSGAKSVTSIQMKMKPGTNLEEARNDLRAAFPPEQTLVHVNTWRDSQGPLLAAVQLETTILNILLFMIIAVAGFGILATFFMIVVEKTRDIGILKSLGAPGAGIASIFLTYGLLLGAVGSGGGAIIGLLFVWNINQIARGIEWMTGREVFDPTVYYFTQIPTVIQPFTIVWVVLGAMSIAVMASVLPSIRAARMHPVRALRYE